VTGTVCSRFSEADATAGRRLIRLGGNPVVGVAADAVPGCAATGVAGMAVRCPMSGPDQAAGPGLSDRGSRSIAHTGGDDPAWITLPTLNP
jgi:hypothetical protein